MSASTTDLILQHLRDGGSIEVFRGKAHLRLSNGTRGANIHPLSFAPLLQQDLLKTKRPIKGRVIYTLKVNEGTNQ